MGNDSLLTCTDRGCKQEVKSWEAPRQRKARGVEQTLVDAESHNPCAAGSIISSAAKDRCSAGAVLVRAGFQYQRKDKGQDWSCRRKYESAA